MVKKADLRTKEAPGGHNSKGSFMAMVMLLPISHLLRPKKVFSAWQIELTTRCHLRCKMCIRAGHDDWHNGDMDIKDFKKLTPYFKNVESVVLEGWGESLLYKNLIDAIRVVKTEGPQVGFVTSGKGLDRKYILELINAGVDFIGFSLAGSSARMHESIRVNSDFLDILENIKTFNEIKASKKLRRPKLHIVYLMLKENISEVTSLMNLAKNIGISDIVLINLIHITNEWQERQRVFMSVGETHFHHYKEYEKILDEAKIKAKELRLNIKLPSLSPVDMPVCEEDPLRNLYISVDGEVSPCVYLYPPVPSPFKRLFCGDEFEVEKVSFGNIFKEPLHKIWNSRRYIEFRECFMQRKRKLEEMLYCFWDVERLRRFEMSPLPESPKQCKTCYKILGV